MFCRNVASSAGKRPTTNRPGHHQRTNEDVPSSIHYSTSSTKRIETRYSSGKESNVKSATPLYHLKGKEVVRYEKVKSLHTMDLFEVALELFNRRSLFVVVRNDVKTSSKMDETVGTKTMNEHIEELQSVNVTENHRNPSKIHNTQVQKAQKVPFKICRYFYECVGKMKVSSQLCTKCRDYGKERDRYDYYYIDLVEISKVRTVRCWNCMYLLLKKNVRGSDQVLREELKVLREEQCRGVTVDPPTISHVMKKYYTT